MQVSTQNATDHAVGHFMRVYLEGDGSLSSYLRRTLRMRLGDRAYDRLEYGSRRRRRDTERDKLKLQLRELLDTMSPAEDGLQVRERVGVLLKVGITDQGDRFYARLDLKRKLVIAFYSEATFNRLQAQRRIREPSSVPTMCR
jgi:hypothetical protein